MHGFVDVDGQVDPHQWVGVLDRIGNEPFYDTYQARVRELLRPVPGGRYLEVGAGTGASAARLAVGHDVRVVAVDRAQTMVGEMRARGLARVAAADAHRLPFHNAVFDGVWADRTVQHVADPHLALDELVRVLRPAGWLVLADPDYDTQVLDIGAQELSRRVVRFRAQVMLRNGTLAHRHAGMLVDRGLVGVSVQARTLVIRDAVAVDNVMGLRSWAATAAGRGWFTQDEAREFEERFDAAVASGRFLYAVTFFLTAGQNKGRPVMALP